MFKNPVYEHDFPDPFVLKVGKTYHAYATNGDGSNVRTLISTNLVNWTPGADAMPELAAWVTPGKNWAPEVLPLPNGKYVMYYVASSTDDFAQCIGHAVSDSPEGPFVDRSKKPFICQSLEGGSIDPSPFRDADGSLYLYWKNDGNCCGKRTYIYAQKMNDDGSELVGKRKRIQTADKEWEGALVEAPEMLTHDGKYYLFYSANDYASSDYAVGYAECEGPMGPCKDAAENPILKSKCDAQGPGHNSFATDHAGNLWIVYHAWHEGEVGTSGAGRVMWIDRLTFEDGKPVIHGPTCAPQPKPDMK